MSEAYRLRELAAWYRELAEKTEEARIWYLRMRTAERLEKEAEQIEARNLRDEHV